MDESSSHRPKELFLQDEGNDVRIAVVEQFFDQLVPPKSLEQLKDEYLKRHNISEDELNDDDKGSIEFRHRNASFVRTRLCKKILDYGIQADQLPDYLSAIITITEGTLVLKDSMDPDDIDLWVDRIKTPEEAEFYATLTTEWNSMFADTMKENLGRTIRDLLLVRKRDPDIRTNFESDRKLYEAVCELHQYVFERRESVGIDKTDLTFVSSCIDVGISTYSPEQLRQMINLYKQMADYPDRDVGGRFAYIAKKYAQNHGLDTDRIKGLIDNILPLLHEDSIETTKLQGNPFGMHEGDFGSGDFICHAYTSRVNPLNINELLIALKDVPGSIYALGEDIRVDALLASEPFGILRDLIHDQRPGVNKLLNEMVEYYENRDVNRMKKAIPIDDEYLHNRSIEQFLDISNYEMEITNYSTGRTERAITIIKRLAENTAPLQKYPPVTRSEEMNGILEKVSNEPDTLDHAIEYVNQKILEMMSRNQLGIDPNFITAIAWLERRVFERLQKMSYEEQHTAYRYKWFINVLQFHELTASVGYDEEEFQSYIRRIESAKSSDEAYIIVSKHTLENVIALAEIRTQEGYDTGVLWSGNLTHELLGLVDYKEAITIQGNKHRAEQQRGKIEPGYNPGG